MRNPTETFIRAFEQIVTEVNRRAGAPSSHTFEIEGAARRDGVIRRHRRLLVYVRDVRNTLQHPGHGSEGDAIQVSEAFLEEVQALLTHLKNPPTAGSVGVPRSRISTASPTDRLGDLADEMRRGGFSHVPILDEYDAVIGVFNEAAVFDYLWSDSETIVGRQMEVSDILPYCRLGAERTESFRFVRPGTPVDEVVDMFLALESPTTRVGAAFVTASGKRTESLQRLITAWDVLEAAAGDSRQNMRPSEEPAAS